MVTRYPGYKDPDADDQTSPINFIRGEDGLIIKSDIFADRIENFELTSEGTLKSIQGPAPFTYDYAQTPVVPSTFTARIFGVHYSRIAKNNRELFLVHAGASVYAYSGWDATSKWTEILGPTGIISDAAFHNDDLVREPTQFISVPNGVIIISQLSGAWFYDGDDCLPLGFSRRPGPPQARGPQNEKVRAATAGTSNNPGLNSRSYAHDGQRGTTTGMHSSYGFCNVGSTEPLPGVMVGGRPRSADECEDYGGYGEVGRLLECRYKYAQQWVDRYGNLSPVSYPSNEVRFVPQASRYFDRTITAAKQKWQPGPTDMVKKQIACISSKGPTGTIGTILYRTRNLTTSGSVDLYEIPGNPAGGSFAFATICDNLAEIFPDNTSDGALIRKAENIIPVGQIRLGCLAFGRFWCTFENEPGVVHFSIPGLHGTFRAEDAISPDVRSGRVTGIAPTKFGVLVTTEFNTFIISPATDSYNGFRYATLSSRLGCVAPSSIKSLLTGETMWLSRSGFVSYDGTDVKLVGVPLVYEFERLNWGRALQACAEINPENGAYTCWVPIDGAERNNVGFCYIGNSWSRRTDVAVDCVAPVENHRGYLICGAAFGGSNMVLVLNRETPAFNINPPTAILETGWINSADALYRRTAFEVILWLRETYRGTCTIDVYRDYRMDSIQTSQFNLYTDERKIQAPIYGTAVMDAALTSESAPNKWRRRRPMHRQLSIAVQSCEVFKIRITSTHLMEFIGIANGTIVHNESTGRTP